MHCSYHINCMQWEGPSGYNDFRPSVKQFLAVGCPNNRCIRAVCVRAVSSDVVRNKLPEDLRTVFSGKLERFKIEAMLNVMAIIRTSNAVNTQDIPPFPPRFHCAILLTFKSPRALSILGMIRHLKVSPDGAFSASDHKKSRSSQEWTFGITKVVTRGIWD